MHMKPDGLVEVQWGRARFRVCNPAGGIRFEVSLAHENTMLSETKSNLERTQNQRSFTMGMTGCVCSRLSSDINASASKKYQQNKIFRALWGWEHLYGRIT